MTDEDDDRMERAKRIRRMREGRRGDSTDENDEESGDGGEPPRDGAGQRSDDGSERNDGDPTDRPSTDGHEAGGESETTPQTDRDDESETTPQTDRDDESEDDPSAATADGPSERSSKAEWFEGEATGDDDQTEMTARELPAADEPATDDETGETTGRDTTGDDDASAAASSAAAAAAAFESDSDDVSAVEAGETADASGSEDAGTTSQPDGPATVSDDADEPTEIEGPAATQSAAETEAEIRVLEFRLGDEQYCLDIQHVEEIVKEGTVTRVPNTPDHVRGVVDLRGQITTILDPKVSLDIDETDDEQLIIVFDEETFEDQGHTGWVVDEVRQVMPIKESEVKDSPLDQQAVNGVIERDGEFVIWTEPEVALLED